MANGENQRGQATVELALVLPVVVLLALIVLQAGLVAKDLLLVQHGAREGARAAAVEPSGEVAREAVIQSGPLQSSRLRVGLSGGSGRGDRATVRVSYLSPTNVPLVGRLVDDIQLESSVTMRVE